MKPTASYLLAILLAFSASASSIKSTDLRPLCPPVYNQNATPCCVPMACVAAQEVNRKARGLAWNGSSVLFAWYNGLLGEGNQALFIDCGTESCLRGMAFFGVCRAATWPFQPYLANTAPTPAAYAQALGGQISDYRHVAVQLKYLDYWLSDRKPVITSLAVYPSTFSPAVAQTGIVPMPSAGEIQIGGHCVLIVGHNLVTHQLVFRNSYGVQWGDGGYGYLPEAWVTTNPGVLTFDWWVIAK